MRKIGILCFAIITQFGCSTSGGEPTLPPVASEDITICNQVWMAKNLDVSAYRNGDPIPQVTDNTAWANLTTGAWCYYNNDPSTGAVYGKLYNWFAVMDPRGLAPVGWHIPNDAEWTTLTTCLGGEPVAGGKLKSTTLWLNPNTGATNSSGFTALPSGLRNSQGSFNSIGQDTRFWTSTINSPVPSKAITKELSTNDDDLYSSASDMKNGLPVRCVKN